MNSSHALSQRPRIAGWNADGVLRQDLLEFGVACRRAASFAADTLVVMGDGSRRPISTIAVGDQVLGWDHDLAHTQVVTVVATLPHTDHLIDAYLSDGAVISVTEDHLLYDAASDSWVEVQHFDDGTLLNVDATSTITIERLDWSARTHAAAFDLTVTGDHNYFIAAHDSSDSVLVHNTGSGTFCGLAVDDDLAADLGEVDRALAVAGQQSAVGDALVRLGDGVVGQTRVDRILDVLAAVARSGDTELARTIAANLRLNDVATAKLISLDLDLVAGGNPNAGRYLERVLGDPVYEPLWTQFSTGIQTRFLDAIGEFAGDELPVAQYLRSTGRDPVRNPLDVLIDEVRRGDAFLDGLETDFKDVTRSTTVNGVGRALGGFVGNGSVPRPQGSAVVVRTAGAAPEVVELLTPEVVQAQVDNFVSGSWLDKFPGFAIEDYIDRIEVQVVGGPPVVWVP